MTAATSAWGQNQQQAQQQQAQVGGIEEIVVTARQRSETLQEIPLAIAAFSAEDIQKAGFRGLDDIALETPGIQFNSTMASGLVGRLNSVIRMRGVSVQSALAHLQPVSLFVDGVFALGGAVTLPIQDLERVEIIKGPQSAFFGRNTFAGAINYITKTPQLDEYQGKVDFSGATYDSYEASVQHTGPIVKDKLGYLANVRMYRKGSQWTATDGGRLGEQSSYTASLSLYAEPTDALNIKVRGFYQKDDDGPPSEGFIRGTTNDSCTGKSYQGFTQAGAAVTILPRAFICGKVPEFGEPGAPIISTNTTLRPAIFSTVRPVYNGEAGGALSAPQASPDFLIQQLLGRKFITGVPTLDGFGMERFTKRLSLNANYEFGRGYMATLTAGYNRMGVNWLRDYDQQNLESWWSSDPQTGRDKSAELRISSPGDDRLRWLAGATYYKQKYVANGAGGLAISACAPFNCAQGPANFGLPAVSGDRAKVWAGYGSLSFDIVEQLTLDVEFRYMQDERTNTQAVGLGYRDFTNKFKQKTPRVILSYKPDKDLTFYGQVSRGTLPGVINGLVAICSNDAFLTPYIVPSGVGFANQGQPSTLSECGQIAAQTPGGALIPNTPTQYLDAAEIGIKSTWMDGRLKANLTGYYYKWKNLPFGLTARLVRDADDPTQRDRIPNTFSNSLGFSTSGSAKYKGAEFETAFSPDEHWDFTGNAGWNKSRFTKLIATGGYSLNVYGQTNYVGKKQPRYPDWQGSVSSTYTDDLVGEWKWFARADLVYMGKYFVDIGNLAHAAPYTLVHTRAGVEKENLRVELFIRNLFDEDSWAGASSQTDFQQGDLTFGPQGVAVSPQDKRQFGLRVNYTF